MHDLTIFIKTYKKDFISFEKLINSIKLYNIENIPVLISVNDKDYNFFKRHIALEEYVLVKDSDIFMTTIKDGWRYQQIIKMNFFRLNFAKFYLSVDSDSVFIKNFVKNDFFVNGKPILIKHKSEAYVKEISTLGFRVEDLFFIKSLKAVKEIFNSPDDQIFDYGPSPYFWESAVWESFFNNYLKDTTVESLFMNLDTIYLPSENAIYGEYVTMSGNFEYEPSEELFKVFHFKEQYNLEPNTDIIHLTEKYKNDYLGIIIQSNFNKINPIYSYLYTFNKIFNKVKC